MLEGIDIFRYRVVILYKLIIKYKCFYFGILNIYLVYDSSRFDRFGV